MSSVWSIVISEAFEPDAMLPAVGQGALAIEHRQGDQVVGDALAPLDHRETRLAIAAERAFLATLEGGCQVPIGGHAVVDGPRVRMAGFLARPDGGDAMRSDAEGSADDAAAIGRRLGDAMVSAGGLAILEAARADA